MPYGVCMYRLTHPLWNKPTHHLPSTASIDHAVLAHIPGEVAAPQRLGEAPPSAVTPENGCADRPQRVQSSSIAHLFSVRCSHRMQSETCRAFIEHLPLFSSPFKNTLIPCWTAQPTCSNGLTGYEASGVCCPVDCGRCGGGGCGDLGDGCCTSDVEDSGIKCSESRSAPCNIDTDSVDPVGMY